MDFNALSKRLIVIALLSFLSACAEDSGEKDSRVVISRGDKIISLNDLQYQLPIVVQVADTDGSPQPNAEVKINLTTSYYYKGQFYFLDTSLPPDGKGDEWGLPDITSPSYPIECAAEDLNNNLILDTGEDINNNGILEPETPTLTPHPDETPTLITGTSSLITDNNGFGYLTITYPKSEAHWVKIKLTATTQGGLPENRDVYEITLPYAIPDLEGSTTDPAPFLYSPYGTVLDCTSTN